MAAPEGRGSRAIQHMQFFKILNIGETQPIIFGNNMVPITFVKMPHTYGRQKIALKEG
ncbi:hypothetical protein [Dyadobacter arcticus]|uniref:Uncharacterized protein n=1 Tax=Dyadobacter arcticus TaxID=1078754 RepID=A0ABX0UN49_9BACT|nr:hypothetical protein [Dyadobacter arcticus]NIJ54352.1 hypothetical protein [Dyadobacter arcticus]